MKRTSQLVLLVFLLSLTFTSAITGSIGNAKMTLNAKQGDIINKTILVRNVNQVPVDVDFSVSGDLAEYVKILDSKFTLQPQEEKKARIEIQVAKSGKTETLIHIKFTPEDGIMADVVAKFGTTIVPAGSSITAYDRWFCTDYSPDQITETWEAQSGECGITKSYSIGVTPY